jgi:hypothetical protein
MSKDPGMIIKELDIPENSYEKYQRGGIPEYIKLIDDAYVTKKQPGSINFSI